MKHARTRRIGSTNVEVTRLGFGGTALAGPMAPRSDAEASALIGKAIESGIRYVDTSPFYGSGLSEHRTGAGLRSVSRMDVVLSTKVGRLLIPEPRATDSVESGALPFRTVFDYSRKGALRSFKESLQRLGVASIDLLLIHDVSHRWHGDRFDAVLAEATAEALPMLAALRDEGVIGAVGLGTNDLEAAVLMAAHGGLDCVMIAREYNLINHRALLRELAPICAERGMSLICAAPYASGILATGLTENATYMYEPPDAAVRNKIAAAEFVCAEFDVPLRAAALQFADLNPLVCSVVAGLRSERELADAIEAFNHPIPDDVWRRMKEEGLIDEHAPTAAGRT
ncbi:MAG: aldo/keto reductase [Pseudomonadota bacterium]